jgi:hypothetical protein
MLHISASQLHAYAGIIVSTASHAIMPSVATNESHLLSSTLIIYLTIIIIISILIFRIIAITLKYIISACHQD